MEMIALNEWLLSASQLTRLSVRVWAEAAAPPFRHAGPRTRHSDRQPGSPEADIC